MLLGWPKGDGALAPDDPNGVGVLLDPAFIAEPPNGVFPLELPPPKPPLELPPKPLPVEILG